MSDKDPDARPEREAGAVPPESDVTTTDRLRRDIDRGEGGDKIGHPDPAAAPLGTDAEAGGQSPTRDEVREVHRVEVERRPTGPVADEGHPVAGDRTESHGPSAAQPSGAGRTRNWTTWIIVAVAILVLLWIIF